MSRSNYDKPFYVDVGTSIVAIRCASNHDVVVEYDHELHPCAIKTLEDACDRMNEEAEIGKHPPIGNAAEMREALAMLIDACASFYESIENGLDGHYEAILDYNSKVDDFLRRVDTAKCAISAPPRNCDKYKTLDDARNAFFAKYVPDDTCSSTTAFAIWLFDEAKGESKCEA